MDKATTTDQSTQVDFPKTRKIKRHNTSSELYVHNRPSWTSIKPAISRPKSLNFATETLNRSKIIYTTDSPLRLSYPVTNDIPLRERTPPFSCNSSIVSNNQKSNGKMKTADEDSSGCSVKCCCNCKCPIIDPIYCPMDSPTGEKRWWRRSNIHSNSTDGLSWRRLHMSRAKLKATATTSELLSGFAMVAMVELQINEPTSVPEWLFVMFAVCTTVLVSVHIFALMISTYILPNIDAIAKLEMCEMVAESPHERMRGFIQIAWAFSTVLGLFLFLVEVAILCWVKFWDYSFPAAIAATVIVIPVLIIFVLFAVHFYHSLVVYKCDASYNDMEKLEDMKKHLDEIANPV